MPMLTAARSFLFAPGHDDRKLRRALASGADVVVIDLEDAVSFEQKGAARDVVRSVLADEPSRGLVAIRVNGADTAFFAADVELVEELRPDVLVLPKATPGAGAALGEEGPPVVAIVETADGLRHAYEVASLPRIKALVVGTVDLGVDLRLEQREDGLEILFARSKVVLDSAAARIRAPIDRVWTDVRDGDGLEADTEFARSLGFRGKACIHPNQVEIVNRVFTPSDEELSRARRVVEAYEQAVGEGEGVTALDGEMIDLPVVERARQVLALVERSAVDAS
ncbi:MAG: CoA ester lyase [Gaiellaceae bacterium]